MKTKIYIMTKDGTLLFAHNLTGTATSESDDSLLSSFLSAVKLFADAMQWPSGTLLIRAGPFECRIGTGEFVFVALFIENTHNLEDMTEPVLGGLVQDICAAFEQKYRRFLDHGGPVLDDRVFADFTPALETVMSTQGAQTFELYQKLLVIQGLYAKIPQKWLMPLFGPVAQGESIYRDLCRIGKMYRQVKKVIRSVNESQAPVWELLEVPLFDPELVE